MATIQDLARWAYENYGKSADFRYTELWSALDPLLSSPFVPSEWKGSVETLAEEGQKKLKNYVESSVLGFENRFGQEASDPDEELISDLFGPDPDDEPDDDYLAEEKPPEVLTNDFEDSTQINYEVFIRE